ncbi:MAG: hypothetical protein ACFFCP_06740, partial [Promethearchaeota archaeon]
AHIDLYRRFGESFYGSAITELWRPFLEELVDKMTRFSIGFEINTSPLRRGMTDTMPDERFIQALKDEGIETVTIGSDAHIPSDVGGGIDEALRIISQIGLPGPSVFRKRKPSVHRLFF